MSSKMPLEFILSQKGKKQLIYKNHLYSIHTKTDNTVNWRCIYYFKTKCCCRVQTNSEENNGVVIRESELEHNHEFEKSELEVIKIKAAIKQKATETSDKPKNVVASETCNIGPSTSFLLMKNTSLNRTIQRQRFKALNVPAIPRNALELDIPLMFQNTLRGEKFILRDYNENNTRILILSTQRNLKLLRKCKQWHGDGTFDSVPDIFHQLYTIHGRHETKRLPIQMKLIPLVYILSTNRTYETYKYVLNALKEEKRNLSPDSIIVDFEMAFIKAINDVFPDSEVHGCFFHFSQAVWRQIQKLGLQIRYQNDEEFSLQVRRLTALAFVPPKDVLYGYKKLVLSTYYTDNFDTLENLLKYFSKTWVGIDNEAVKKLPRYAIELWNCYNAVVNDEARTNNGVEGWHRGFNVKVGESHANIWKFLKIIQNEQGTQENIINDINNGVQVEGRKRKYVELDQRLLSVVKNYKKKNVLSYLESIAVNVYFTNYKKSNVA